jgi:hypothetical protein
MVLLERFLLDLGLIRLERNSKVLGKSKRNSIRTSMGSTSPIGCPCPNHAEVKSFLKKCRGDKDKFGKSPDGEVFTFYERINSGRNSMPSVGIGVINLALRITKTRPHESVGTDVTLCRAP